MTLKEFKNHIDSFTYNKVFDYSISNPFSWRGVYSEVAFTIKPIPSDKEDVLSKINKAYDNEFYGYKGGNYKYDDNTDIHFESEPSSWSDGGYTEELISKILGLTPSRSPEERLIILIFPIEN
jgi:hypothetical protein